MKRETGRVTVLSLLMLALLVVGGFMAFKYLSSNFSKREIKREVYDTIGTIRGGGVTVERMEGAINEVLVKRGVKPLEINVEFREGQIDYSFSYEITTDYLLFKKIETIEVADEMDNAGI